MVVDYDRTREQIAKLMEDTVRLSQEPVWLPLIGGAVFMAVAVSLTYLLIK